jgi:hypothetical protein
VSVGSTIVTLTLQQLQNLQVDLEVLPLVADFEA